MNKEETHTLQLKKIPSAEEYLNQYAVENGYESWAWLTTVLTSSVVKHSAKCLESYALLREQRAVEVEKSVLYRDVMITIAECLPEGHIHELDYKILKGHLTAILNNGKQ